MKDAGRKVEDILAPENEDATLEVSRLELADLRADLELYQEVKNANGEIRAEHGGMVTDIFITTGGRTSDSAVMLLADDSVPCQFKTTLTQEQKKYVGLSDTVSLKLDGSSKEKEAVIDYLAESSSAPGSYEVYINLPEGTGVPGMSGTMSHVESGEKRPCCVTPAGSRIRMTTLWRWRMRRWIRRTGSLYLLPRRLKMGRSSGCRSRIR